ncbi:MAG: DUF547 domain-containing protein [Leptospira sp.]|nr:DUF547 domain-containing protein [Leptospira sp.]
MSKISLTFLLSFCSFTSIFSQSFDHTHKLWDQVLKKNVNQGLVNYQGIEKDSSIFKSYLSTLSSVSESEYSSFSQSQKIAFLINAYNAFTIQLILDHYPLKSITDIGSPFSKLNLVRGTPWKKDFFTLLGKVRNLDWIEHEKLRKDFNEPRIHFAIVCASIGCPSLSSDAYTGSSLSTQLQTSKLNFLKNPTKNSYDKTKNVLALSKIFDWFKGDFTKNGTLIEFIQEGFTEKIPADALIEYNDYSWRLNEQK